MKSLQIAVLIGVIAAFGTVPATAQESHASEKGNQADADGGRTLEGTWDVTVSTLSDCTVRKPVSTFTAILTFAKGGTMSGTTSNPGFMPGQRTSDYGVWTREGDPSTYRAVSKALVLFDTNPPNPPPAPSFLKGAQVIIQSITVTDRDHFTSDATTQLYDSHGARYKDLCASAAGVRFP